MNAGRNGGRPPLRNQLYHSCGVFAIGSLATLCATLLPRLIASVSLAGENSYLDFFKADFMVSVLALTVLVGLVMVVLEFAERRAPRQIFFNALGIPALIVGTYSTAGGASDFANAAAQRDAATLSLLSAASVGIERPQTATKLRLLSPIAPESQSRLDPAPLLIPPAHAQDDGSSGKLVDPAPGFDAGFGRAGPSYVIVLTKATSEADAVAKAKELLPKVPTAQAAAVGDKYYVISGVRPLPLAKAGAEAFKLKGDNPEWATPTLLEIK